MFGEDLVGVAVELWAAGIEQGLEFLVGSRGAEVAPAVYQVGFVAFADQRRAVQRP